MKRLLFTIASLAIATICCQAANQYDTFTTKSGKTVTITFIKHASLEIKYDGKIFQIDPVGLNVKPETDYAHFEKANYVLVTHEHPDHFDKLAIAAVRTPATTIYMNQRCYDSYRLGMVMRNGDSIRIAEDISLKAVPAYNTTPGREEMHPKGRDNGYVLTLDGLRIYIAGDTEDIPEMAELGDIDIAFLPCNQPYTMTPDQLVKAAKTIRPKTLYPYHYSETPINRLLILLAGSGIDVRIRNMK